MEYKHYKRFSLTFMNHVILSCKYKTKMFSIKVSVIKVNNDFYQRL